MLLEQTKALPKDMELRAKTAEEKVWHSKVNCRDAKGWTPVCIAAFKKNAKMVELLLSHGADPRLPNQYNKTAFDFVRKKVDILNNVNDEGNPVIFEMLSRWDSKDATAEKIQHSVASNEVVAGGGGGGGGGDGEGVGGDDAGKAAAAAAATASDGGNKGATAAADATAAVPEDDSKTKSGKKKKKGKKKGSCAGSAACAVNNLKKNKGKKKKKKKA